MNKKYILLIAVLCLVNSLVHAQSSVSVSPLTGSADVAIPIYNFTRGQVGFPITLVYNGSGIKLKEVEGTAGMGWNIQAGGQVSRQLRGLPDDCSRDSSSNHRYGWMSGSNTAPAYTAGIADNLGNCTTETSDLSYISTHFPIENDIEPDIFYVTAPGLSCQLIYNRDSLKFKPIYNQDLIITYTTSSGEITSFTIINDKGVKYVFSQPERAFMQTTGSSPLFFTTKFLQYQHGIRYYDNWHLTSVTGPDGNGLILKYATGTQPRGSTDAVDVYVAEAEKPQYTIAQSMTQKLLDTVYSVNRLNQTLEVTFHWATNLKSAGGTDRSYVDTIKGRGKVLVFNYSAVKYTMSSGSAYYRQFLRSYIDGSANSPINYRFTYYNETYNSSTGKYTTVLPDSTSSQVDFWGYYTAAPLGIVPGILVNPATSGYQRYRIQQSGGDAVYTYKIGGGGQDVDSANIVTGVLHTINYAQGGRTTIAYEPNNYYDPEAGVNYNGNGIRVRTVTDDGFWGTPQMVRNYTYINPSSGKSSGKPISLPQFAFTIPYNGGDTGADFWEDATAISPVDLSEEDHTIMYEYARESQTNGGVTQYQYFLPATYWDASATPACYGCGTADWAPTVDMIARHNCASAYGPVGNATYSYPFIPNLNYDFERGLLKKVINYKDGGTTEVSETNYTYQRSASTPPVMYGARFDLITNNSLVITGYNRYPVYYGISELSRSVSNTVYNTSDYSQAQTSSVSYTFGSSYHKLLTQQDATNSDGSTVTTKITYTKDFPSAVASTNVNVDAIYHLKQLNVNIPVESYQSVTKGGTTKITGGSISLYKAFLDSRDESMYLPSQQLRLVQPDGLATGSFSAANITGSTGSQALNYNSNYFTVANYTNYDNIGYPLTADDNNHHVATSAIDRNNYRVYITAKNAASTSVGFNNFDSDGDIQNFIVSGTLTKNIGDGHTGNSCALATTQNATASITRDGAAQKYVFSAWVKSTGNNTLHVSVNGGTAVNIAYTGTGSWMYIEKKIDVSSVTAGAYFTIALTSTNAISVDDILAYPETAEVMTYSYDPVTYAKNAQTDTNGVSVYYKNDEWGRTLYVYDQDHNIIQRTQYIIPPLNNY